MWNFEIQMFQSFNGKIQKRKNLKRFRSFDRLDHLSVPHRIVSDNVSYVSKCIHLRSIQCATDRYGERFTFWFLLQFLFFIFFCFVSFCICLCLVFIASHHFMFENKFSNIRKRSENSEILWKNKHFQIISIT